MTLIRSSLKTKLKTTKTNGIYTAPNQRFLMIGKSGSGKTAAMMNLGIVIVPKMSKPTHDWEVWYIYTKGDSTDLIRLAKLGYVPYSLKDNKEWDTSTVRHWYFYLKPSDSMSIEAQIQVICAMALERGQVFLMIDELVHAIYSRVNPGKKLKEVIHVGRGLDVGAAYGSQEPVNIPRQVFTQSNHIFLFHLFFTNDITFVKKMFAGWTRPKSPYGFWYTYVDQLSHNSSNDLTNMDWKEYNNFQEWVEQFPHSERYKLIF